MMVELIDSQIEHLKRLGYEDPPKTADLSPERLDKLRVRWSHHGHLTSEEIEDRAICQAVWEQRTNTNPQFVDSSQAPVDNMFALVRKLDGIAETIRGNVYPDARPEIAEVIAAVHDGTSVLERGNQDAALRNVHSQEVAR